MRKIPIPVALVLMSIFLFPLSQRACADGKFILRGAAAFKPAIADGRIKGVDPAAGDARTLSNLIALNKAYPGEGAQFTKTAVGTNTSPIDGLVSATGTAAAQAKKMIGAWSYRYMIDPDFSALAFELLEVFPQIGPVSTPGINTMSISLIDASDLVKLWRWDDTALFTGGQLFTFRFSEGVGAGGSTSFFADPGFDLTNVLEIQVGYRGLLTFSYPPTPPPDETPPPYGDRAMWVGSQREASVPEPGTWTPLLLGTLGLAGWRLCGRVRKG